MGPKTLFYIIKAPTPMEFAAQELDSRRVSIEAWAV